MKMNEENWTAPCVVVNIKDNPLTVLSRTYSQLSLAPIKPGPCSERVFALVVGVSCLCGWW